MFASYGFIESEEICHLVTALFSCVKKIVQSCEYAEFCSPEEEFHLSSTNTVQTVGEFGHAYQCS